MVKSSYYVYGLKDSRQSPPQLFYVGKGSGNRAWEHQLRPDDTRKGKRIREILDAGASVGTSILSDGLSEIQAIKLEAELIAALGTETSGGILANTVIPTGEAAISVTNVSVPPGVRERARLGLDLLKGAVLELAAANSDGLTNSEVARTLGLQSDYRGGSVNYLSHGLLGLLLKEGTLERPDDSTRHRFVERRIISG